MRPYLIIHPEYLPTPGGPLTSTLVSSGQEAAGQQQQQQRQQSSASNTRQALASPDQAALELAQASNSNTSNSKVIRIYFPNKSIAGRLTSTSSGANSSSNADSGQQGAGNAKKPRFDPAELAASDSSARQQQQQQQRNETASQGTFQQPSCSNIALPHSVHHFPITLKLS